jgi:uncharacterized protein YyaL (SSP411 family)
MTNREEILKVALEFLMESIDHENGGSRAYFSRILNPRSGWSAMYPETSGYIIPTLILCSEKFNEDIYMIKATQMANWLLSIQFEDGGFPALLYNKNNLEKSIFNSAQILIGLVSIYKETGFEKYLIAILKCANWIITNQNIDGSWTKFNYKKDFTPSYYTRVAWPLLLVWELTYDDRIMIAANKTLQLIAKRKGENGFIKYSGFEKNSYAFTHTIAYVIRGFFESSQILNNNEYEEISVKWSEYLVSSFLLNGKLPGAYFDNNKKVGYYECLTGYCQLAIIWLKTYDLTNDARFKIGASLAIDRVSNLLPKKNFLYKKGGVQGSYPFFGRYYLFRQPNWATKFFIDAIILESGLIKS